MRSVQTVGSTHAQRARISPSCGAVAGTADGVCSIGLSFTLPPSCLPWLHGHYPASMLLRRLCHLPGAVLRALCAAMNAAPSRIVIPDSCRSNFQPFYLHPPDASLSLRSLSPRRSGREVAALPSRVGFRLGLRHSLAGSPMHLAVSSSSFSCLWTGCSLPAALHPASRRRSCLQLRTASALSDGDFHPAVGAHSRAHEGARSLGAGNPMGQCSAPAAPQPTLVFVVPMEF